MRRSSGCRRRRPAARGSTARRRAAPAGLRCTASENSARSPAAVAEIEAAPSGGTDERNAERPTPPPPQRHRRAAPQVRSMTSCGVVSGFPLSSSAGTRNRRSERRGKQARAGVERPVAAGPRTGRFRSARFIGCQLRCRRRLLGRDRAMPGHERSVEPSEQNGHRRKSTTTATKDRSRAIWGPTFHQRIDALRPMRGATHRRHSRTEPAATRFGRTRRIGNAPSEHHPRGRNS